MFNKIIDGVNNLEDMMCEYSEMNSCLYSNYKIFMIASNSVYSTPEYNHQPYTFMYGDYSLGDYIKSYV